MWRRSGMMGVQLCCIARGLILTAKPRSNACTRAGVCNETQRAISTTNSQMKQAYIAVGSSLGDRHQNITNGVKMLCNSSEVNLIRTSFLHESDVAPMHAQDQETGFVNGVVLVETSLLPNDLLQRLKQVERELGQSFSRVSHGLRTLDLEIVLYGEETIERDSLVIPHPRIHEREFVLTPLCEAGASGIVHPTLQTTIGDLTQEFRKAHPLPTTVRTLPLPRGRSLRFSETLVMGIINATPDSFSDGGKYKGDAELAAQSALQMELDGASIIDVGGESTRPGAIEVPVDEELQRTIPVIQRIRELSDIPISIDSRHAEVARAAVEAGADIVNDVSAGEFDEKMLPTLAELGVPVILMLMRGKPENVLSIAESGDVVQAVCGALLERSRQAEAAGIPRWMQVLDPGFGSAKGLRGSLRLLKNLRQLQSKTGDFPILVGTSRKAFIGEVTGETIPAERDFGTVATCVAALCLGDEASPGCHVLRVHNVKGTKQAAMTMDAIVRVDPQDTNSKADGG